MAWAAASAACTSSTLRASPARISTRAPGTSPCSSARVFSRASRWRAISSTLAPSRASHLALYLPIAPLPPVIKAVFPAKGRLSLMVFSATPIGQQHRTISPDRPHTQSPGDFERSAFLAITCYFQHYTVSLAARSDFTRALQTPATGISAHCDSVTLPIGQRRVIPIQRGSESPGQGGIDRWQGWIASARSFSRRCL